MPVISIFGLGYVGCVSLGCLSKNGFKVIGVDINQNKVDQINHGMPTIIENKIAEIVNESYKKGLISATNDNNYAVQNSDISIIAVGTPSTPKGHLDLSIIFDLAKEIGVSLRNKNKFHLIAIRSTVMPGTCEKFISIVEEVSAKKNNKDFSVLSNPEFLREGTAVDDYFNPPYTLIGTDNIENAQQLADLYKSLPAKVIITQTKIAELMKYINNTFHALKISFANEIGNICKALNIDSYGLMEIFCQDTSLNISDYYLKPGFAFGGSCLPKDLLALQTLAHDQYVKVPVIENIMHSNRVQIQRTIDILNNYKDKKLGFLGLSFKEGTDDFRNSPSVSVIESMLGRGFNLKIFDRNINQAQLTGTNKDFIEKRIPHLTSLLVNEIEELTEFSDVIVICIKDKKYLEIMKNIDGKIIIDLVHLDDSIINKPNYYGINW